ncbi:hypothetical protein CBR_g53809 [Chara braunii]|uniref:Uncharacterized protein n=1 Tax=Chara braunii TaxID=69332 RepID=A0A388K726_CHABU|nr:hypothetical protein CBR_g53809 [Chara braunii]|eukprot:GBG65837.1 hypothetical protein CBR_g53809 [Chara braunii]
MVETRSGTSTSPYTQEQQEKMAALVRENKERKELLKQAKLKAIAEEQAAKMKKLEEEMNEWIANLSLGEDEEAKSYVPQDERDALASELATMEDPLERREREEEKLEWKLRMKREKKRRRDEVNRLTEEVAKMRDCRQEVQAQTDMSANMDKVLGYLEVLSAAWVGGAPSQ